MLQMNFYQSTQNAIVMYDCHKQLFDKVHSEEIQQTGVSLRKHNMP
jgi:hypothetical protein